MFVPTTATHKHLALKKRIRGVAGGTSAGKTISIEQILIDHAQADVEPTLTSITSESFPHLKRGAIRDFRNMMIEHRYWDDFCWNATDYTYTFPLRDPISGKLVTKHGSKLEFFSVDQPVKVRGPRRQRLFVNEANNIPYETFDQLEVRTEDEIWLDWNPTYEYWFYTEVLGKRADVDFITLTYKDNEGLPESIIQSIEAHRHNKVWWQVYGLGQLGEVEGKVYKDWQFIDEVPHEARLERRPLDFGYSADPAALLDIFYHNGGYIFDEQLYRKGMSNKSIADFINNLDKPHTLVPADSAEPKSIDELRLYGINAIPAQKGPGSINQGIQYVQDQRISVTKRSVNLIKEYRSYMWKFDKDGKQLNVPEPGNDHLMDAIRYGMETLRPHKVVAPRTPDWVKQRRAQWN